MLENGHPTLLFQLTPPDRRRVMRRFSLDRLWHEACEARCPVLPVVPTTRLALPVSPLCVLLRNSSGSSGGVESTGWIDKAALIIEEAPNGLVTACARGSAGHSSHTIWVYCPHACLLRILHRVCEKLLLPTRLVGVAAAAAAAAPPPPPLLPLFVFLPRPPLLPAAAAAAAAAAASAFAVTTTAAPPALFPRA